MVSYPKELFSIREDATRRNLADYDNKRKIWYDAAEKLYPDYFKRNLRERLAVRETINDYVGFSL